MTETAVQTFENARWSAAAQNPEFRHTAAASLTTKGPVLDIGCGDGLLLGLLKKNGIEAQGIDLSPVAVERATSSGLIAATYDASNPLPFPDNAFESVILLDVLEHVYDPLRLLTDAARVSRTEVIIGVPNFSSLPARAQVLLGNVPENNRPNKGHVYWFNQQVLSRLATQANLHEIDRKMNTFKFAALFGSFFPRMWPNVFALSFVVRFSKENAVTKP